MTLDANGKRLRCDGDGCKAETQVPVALRNTLNLTAPPGNLAGGWLFVVRHNRTLHFCPVCGRRHLLDSPDGFFRTEPHAHPPPGGE